jgi:transcriptional regulator with XRE-family HTH domain
MTNNNNKYLGRILKQRRIMIPLTLRGLAAISGTSSSHLGRIERGERFPSASVLRKIAKPLGFEESELFSLAGYLSPQPSSPDERSADYSGGRLDPYVGRILSQEPVEVQRTVIGILSILKSIARAVK